MFTGIIQAIGKIERIERGPEHARLCIQANGLDLSDVQLGDSIAVSGPCLTVVEFDEKQFSVDVSSETLDRTSLGAKRAGDGVNLEKALRLADRLGGHLVSGHVDGVGRITTRTELSEYVRFAVEAPPELAKYIAHKGSVSVDGVSLTVNAVDGVNFDLMIIPHTLTETTLGELRDSAEVNLEIDLVARYLERLGQFDSLPTVTSGVDKDTLRDSGFLRD